MIFRDILLQNTSKMTFKSNNIWIKSLLDENLKVFLMISAALNFIAAKSNRSWKIITSMLQSILHFCLSFLLVHFRFYIVHITITTSTKMT